MSSAGTTAEGIEAAEFTRLVEEHAGLVFSAVYAVIPRTEEADDLAQETFLRAWEKRATLRDRRAAPSWLYRIARNTAISHLRKQLPYGVELAPIEEVDAVSASPSPQQAAMDAQMGEILHHSLEQIPDAYRVPLILSVMEGYPARKIAELMGVSEEVVRQRLSRGRAILKHETEARLEEARRKRRSAKSVAAAVMASILSGGTATKAVAAPVVITGSLVWAGGGVLAVLGLAAWLVMCAGNETSQTGAGSAAEPNGAAAHTATHRILLNLTVLEPDGTPTTGDKVWLTTNEWYLLLRTDEDGTLVTTLDLRARLNTT